VRHTNRTIFLFWLPLAATWAMMALEGPFLAAVIARLADPKFNLAAYGVAFAFAILVEAPVIMLMSAATALVEDSESYRRLRNFTGGLNLLATAMLLVVLAPGVYTRLMVGMIGLPTEVAELTHGALWILLPWPAAIGYRRFLQGLLIRSGRTRLVAMGTVIRLAAMAAVATALFVLTDLPGAWVGAAALSTAVCAEALAAHFMAAPTVRELKAMPQAAGNRLGYRDIVAFYYPLALTSFLALAVQPMLTFFMGRSPSPIESLAVFPVVNSLSFVFRSMGMSFQEAVIALIGKNHEHYPELARFGTILGLASTGGLALVAFTPLSSFWFETLSGLTPDLAAFAFVPTMVLVPLPALTVLLTLQRGVLMQGRRTRPVTLATATEVAVIASVFAVSAWGAGLVGVTAATVAFAMGRTASNVLLSRFTGPLLRAAGHAR
jgi:hypothetical protein